jgi:hypothetical protein
MSDQHTIIYVSNIAIAMSAKLTKGTPPLHIVTRQNCFVTYLNKVLLQYPHHTTVGDIEVANAFSGPIAKKADNKQN